MLGDLAWCLLGWPVSVSGGLLPSHMLEQFAPFTAPQFSKKLSGSKQIFSSPRKEHITPSKCHCPKQVTRPTQIQVEGK